MERPPLDVSWVELGAEDLLLDEVLRATFTFRGCYQPWNTSCTFEHLPAAGPTQCSFGLERASRDGSHRRKLGPSLD